MPISNILTFPGSVWRDRISLAILELQEKGQIQIMYDKWWKNTGDVCNRDEKNKESKANALGVENIGNITCLIIHNLGEKKNIITTRKQKNFHVSFSFFFLKHFNCFPVTCKSR